MKQVDFYLISNRIIDAKYKLASRLANKLQRLEQKILIITNNTEATTVLDTVMWSFSDTSFLAHDHINDASEVSKVQITDHNSVSPAALERNFDVLINLSSDIPMFNHHFERIAEIVEEDEAAKTAARTRYKSYQNEGFELKTHSIEL